MIGEPRRTLGGGGDVARDAAGQLNQYAFALAPTRAAAPTESTDTTKRTKCAKPVALLATATDPRATASRLKELAEAPAAPCCAARARRRRAGGRRRGGRARGVPRAHGNAPGFEPEAAKARRRKPVTHLLASADVVAELEAVGRFGA